MSSFPAEWTSTKLGKVAKEMFGGGTPSTKNPSFWQGNIPWLTSKSLGDAIYLTAGEKTISEEAVRKSATHVVPAGNLIFATRVGVGKVVVTKIDVAISQDGTGIVIDPTEVDPTFLAYQLRTDSVQRFVQQNKRGATIQGITRTSLQQVDVLIPPLPEQRRIAHVLTTVQTAIEQQARLIALTRELKSALMKKLFTEGLHGEPQKETEIGLVPASWNVGKFIEFCILQRGFDITKKEQTAGYVPVVSSGGIGSYHNVAKVKAPGVVIGRKGSLGTVHYIDVDYWPHDTTLWVKDFKGNNPLFTAYFIETLQLKKYNSGVSNPTLNRNTVHADTVCWPQVDEQKEIGQILNQCDSKIRIIEQKKNLLEELFRTLLHQLMTGQIRLNEANVTGF